MKLKRSKIIHLECPVCKQVKEVEYKLFSKEKTCPKCGNEMRVKI